MAKQKPSKAYPTPLTRSQELWLIACALPTLAPHVEHAPLWLSLATAGALAWRGLIWWRRWPLPPRWLLTLLVIAGIIAVSAFYRHFFGKDPGVALLILFLALKLMEARGVRDGLAAIFLCYFLLLTDFLYAQSIAVAGVTLAALVVITAALASLADARRAAAELVRLSALMLAQALPFMLVLFLLFPRAQGPLWGIPVDAYTGMTGLSDTMSPGSISALTRSGAIAFRANFEGNPPAHSALYWRGPVLRDFDGQTWRTGRKTASSKLPYDGSGPELAYAITLEPHNKTWLFALDMPAMLPPNTLITSDYQVLARAPIRARIRYELRSRLGMTPGADELEDNLETSLELPTGSNPRARELAAEWRRQHGADEAVVRQVLGYFRRESFFYTLSPPLLGVNGIDEFLFETRRGFCEHYAGAFVFLMRAAGIPARVVTGYQGGEQNPIDGYLIVRQSDAHAWAEVWLSGRGWVRIDPTAAIAPSRIESGLAAAVPEGEPLPFLMRGNLSRLRDLRFRWEAMNNSWNQWVLGYNPERQREVLSRLGLREPDWRSMSAVLTALCGILMLAYVAWALRRRIRVDPVLRAWNRLSRKLGRLGLARRSWEGPADYARRVAQAQPKLEIDIQRIAALYIALRYGGGPKPQHEERTSLARNAVADRAQLLRELNQSIAGLNGGTTWTI